MYKEKAAGDAPAAENSWLPSWWRSGKVDRMAVAMLAGKLAWKLFTDYRNQKAAREMFIIKFRELSEEGTWVKRWLATQNLIEDEKATSTYRAVYHGSHSGEKLVGSPTLIEADEAEASKSKGAKNGWLVSPETVVGFDFHGMRVSVETEDTESKEKDGYRMGLPNLILRCTPRRPDLIDLLLAEIYAVGTARPEITYPPGVYVQTPWGDWQMVRRAPKNRRPVLPKGVLEKLEDDARWFCQNEGFYQERGVPYRRGYLLHGVSGSGKTTTAIALASVLDRDIYLLSLRDMTDEKLLQAFNRLSPHSMVVMEDIDCIAATNTREEVVPTAPATPDTGKLTLAGLLNAIDGIATPDGRIVLATTNYRERIDHALLRPGRFDMEIEFKNADIYQIKALCERFGIQASEAEETAHLWAREGISMAAVQERLIEKQGIKPKQLLTNV